MSSESFIARIELLQDMMNRGLFIWKGERWHVQKSPTAADMKMAISESMSPRNHILSFDDYHEAFEWCVRYCLENPLST